MRRHRQARRAAGRHLRARLLLGLSVVALGLGCVSLRPWAELRQELPDDRFVRVRVSGEGLPDRSYQVYVRSTGPRHGDPAPATVPILLLHGFGASSFAWREVIPPLAEHHRVLAVDLFGFGYTERPRDLSLYTRTGQTALVLGVLDALEHPTAHVVGHSYGGSLALTLAARHPQRVASLVGVDAAHPDYPQLRRRAVARLPGLSAFVLRGLWLRRTFVERSLERSYADDGLVTPELVDAYRERVRISGAVRAYKGLTVPQPDPGPPVRLEEVRVPTLMLWGTEDPLISVETGRQATAKIPGATFVEIPGAGHAPHEEKPAAVAERVLEFLRAQGGSR